MVAMLSQNVLVRRSSTRSSIKTSMKASIDQVANDLARAHREADTNTTLIKLFGSDPPDEIHLLEVSSSAPTSGEVLPFKFAPVPENGVDYPSVIILLSPAEWQQVEDGVLQLPNGWNLAKAVDLYCL